MTCRVSEAPLRLIRVHSVRVPDALPAACTLWSLGAVPTLARSRAQWVGSATRLDPDQVWRAVALRAPTPSRTAGVLRAFTTPCSFTPCTWKTCFAVSSPQWIRTKADLDKLSRATITACNGWYRLTGELKSEILVIRRLSFTHRICRGALEATRLPVWGKRSPRRPRVPRGTAQWRAPGTGAKRPMKSTAAVKNCLRLSRVCSV